MNRRTVLMAAGAAAVASVAPAAASEATDANKALAIRYVTERAGNGDLSFVDEIVSPDYSSEDPAYAPGLDALKERLTTFRQFFGANFESYAEEVKSAVAEGNKVVLRSLMTGVNRGRNVAGDSFMEFQFKDGLITRIWGVYDEAALFPL